jgi:hypothetical protein
MPLRGFKVVPIKRSIGTDPASRARAVILAALENQIQAADAEAKGKDFSPRGAKRFTKWFWKNQTGTYYVEVRYGLRVIPLDASGNTTIEVGKISDLKPALVSLKDAVNEGQLDEAVENMPHRGGRKRRGRPAKMSGAEAAPKKRRGRPPGSGKKKRGPRRPKKGA